MFEDKENTENIIHGDQANDKNLKLYGTLSGNQKPVNHNSVTNRTFDTFTKQFSKLFLQLSDSAQSTDQEPNDFIIRTLPLSDKQPSQNNHKKKNHYTQNSNTDSIPSKKIPEEMKTLPLSDVRTSSTRNCRNSPKKQHQRSLTDCKTLPSAISREESIPKIITLNDQNPRTSSHNYRRVKKHYAQKSCTDPVVVPQDVKDTHLPKSYHLMDELDYSVLSQTPKISVEKDYHHTLEVKHVQKMQSRSCNKCKIHIPDSVTYIEYGNRYYHPDCVVCHTCQKNPVNQLFTIHSDEIYCEQCFNSFLVGNIVEFTDKDVDELFVFN